MNELLELIRTGLIIYCVGTIAGFILFVVAMRRGWIEKFMNYIFRLDK